MRKLPRFPGSGENSWSKTNNKCGCGGDDGLPDWGVQVPRNGSIRLPKRLVRTTRAVPSRIGSRPRVPGRGIGKFSQFSYHVSPLRLFFEMANGPRGVLSGGRPGERRPTGHKMCQKSPNLGKFSRLSYRFARQIKRLISNMLQYNLEIKMVM